MIDLRSVMQNNPKCLENRATLRSLLKDMYPKEKRTIHVLLDTYESGVVGKFRNLKQISKMQMESYITQLVDEYGLQRQYAQEGIEVWAKALNIPFAKNAAPPIKPVPSKNPSISQAPLSPVNGNISDYKLKTLPDGTVEIEKFVRFDWAKMTVPNMIGGKWVKGIGKEAYKDCLNLQELIICEGIEYIEPRAFADCANLKRIQMPNSMKRIGNTDEGFAFCNCSQLKDVRLPVSMKCIGVGTFCGCRMLEKIILPVDLERICAYAFADTQLRKIYFPQSIKSIDKSAFYRCNTLTRIELKEGIETIGASAFHQCDLKEVLLPRSLKTIGENAFECGATLFCYEDSKSVLQYARENGFRVADAATWKNSTS